MWEYVKVIVMGIVDFLSEFEKTYREVDERVWNNTKYCSECSLKNDVDNNYCIGCGHKLKNVKGRSDRKYCSVCGARNDVESKYCCDCGCEMRFSGKLKKCAVCGEWIGDCKYCCNCGHDTFGRSSLVLSSDVKLSNVLCSNVRDRDVDLRLVKVCPNCNVKFQKYFNYCEYCGAKLKKR